MSEQSLDLQAPKSLPNTSTPLEQAVRTAETISNLIKSKLEMPVTSKGPMMKLINGFLGQLDKILELSPEYRIYNLFPKLNIIKDWPPEHPIDYVQLMPADRFFLKELKNDKAKWKVYKSELERISNTNLESFYPELDELIIKYENYKKQTIDKIQQVLIPHFSNYYEYYDNHGPYAIIWAGKDITDYLYLNRKVNLGEIGHLNLRKCKEYEFGDEDCCWYFTYRCVDNNLRVQVPSEVDPCFSLDTEPLKINDNYYVVFRLYNYTDHRNPKFTTVAWVVDRQLKSETRSFFYEHAKMETDTKTGTTTIVAPSADDFDYREINDQPKITLIISQDNCMETIGEDTRKVYVYRTNF